MASAGEISVKLTAVTAQFEQGMTKAAKSLEKVSQAIDLNRLKKFGSDIERAFQAIAKVSPEADAAMKRLDKSVESVLKKLGPGAAWLSDNIFTAIVELVENAIEGFGILARMAGTFAGGGSWEDWKENEAKLLEDRETTKLGMTMGLVDVVGTPTANAAEKAAKAAADVAEKTAEAWAEAFDGVDYTNMAEAITSNLAEQLDRDAAELLSQIPDSPTVSPLAGQYAAMQARQTQAESAYYSGLGDQVMGGSGRPGQVIQAGVQGGQAGGAPGALAAVGTDLLMHSEAFASMLEKTTGILQTLADTVGIVLEPALDAISWVFEQVARIILNVIKAILVVLDKLPGIDFGDEIKKIDSKLKGLGKSAEDAGKEIGKTFSSANVPQGFKTAMAQADATKGIVVQNLTVTADDTKKIKKELTAEAERRLHAGSTTEAK